MRWHWTHGRGQGVVTQHGTCAGTGHTDVAKRECLCPRGNVPELGLIDEDVDLS
uniref:Uncharacterized protein n=1 Tax=Oryza sativa subsp. japonica TaxID=39947 RepID=Q6K3M1_ORYSJ|nr:hypothetical protein [Oryza sativa Japonica Group]